MQPNKPEDSTDLASVSAALEATREMLELTRAQLAEAQERENRLLAIIESRARLPEQKPPTEKKLRIWVAALGMMALTGVGALWWWQATKATAPGAPPAAEVAPQQSTTPSPAKPNDGSTSKVRPKKKLPPVPRPGEVRINGGQTNWFFYKETAGVRPG